MPRERGPLRENFGGEIAPIRIGLLDQGYLPFAAPALYCPLAGTRLNDGCEFLVMDQENYPIGLCKPRRQLGLVYRDPPGEVFGDADIQHAARTICEDVDEEPLVHGRGSLLQPGYHS